MVCTSQGGCGETRCPFGRLSGAPEPSQHVHMRSGMFAPKPQENGCREQETAQGVNAAERSSVVVTEASLDLACGSFYPPLPPGWLWCSGGVQRPRTRETEA